MKVKSSIKLALKISISCTLILSLLLNSVATNSKISVYDINLDVFSALTPHERIEIICDANFTDYGFPGSGTEIDPYVIEGYTITITAYGYYGILVYNVTKHFIIQHCFIEYAFSGIHIESISVGTAIINNNTCVSSNYAGIYLSDSSNSTIVNNTCLSNYVGIELHNSENCSIEKNTCGGNTFEGIALLYLESCYVFDNDCFYNKWGIKLLQASSIIINNTFNEGDIGIYLYSIVHFYYHSTVMNNTCSNNNYYGIKLLGYSCSTIAYNDCSNNKNGIKLMDADSNVIRHNLFNRNYDYGAYIDEYSVDNIIHHNEFVDNNLYITQGPQAFDGGSNNTWYDKTSNKGNYWSDYSTIPYLIDGSAGSIDPWPLGEPIVTTLTTSSETVSSTTEKSSFPILFVVFSLIVNVCLLSSVYKRRR